jgi:hypothetical protein
VVEAEELCEEGARVCTGCQIIDSMRRPKVGKKHAPFGIFGFRTTSRVVGDVFTSSSSCPQRWSSMPSLMAEAMRMNASGCAEIAPEVEPKTENSVREVCVSLVVLVYY